MSARRKLARAALGKVAEAEELLRELAEDVEEDEVGMSVEDDAAALRLVAERLEALRQRL